MKEAEIQELILMRMNLRAIRDRINQDLDALSEKIKVLIPEERSRAREPITDIAAELNSWPCFKGLPPFKSNNKPSQKRKSTSVSTRKSHEK